MGEHRKWEIPGAGKNIWLVAIITGCLIGSLVLSGSIALAISEDDFQEIDVTKMPTPVGSSTLCGKRGKMEWVGKSFHVYMGPTHCIPQISTEQEGNFKASLFVVPKKSSEGWFNTMEAGILFGNMGDANFPEDGSVLFVKYVGGGNPGMPGIPGQLIDDFFKVYVYEVRGGLRPITIKKYQKDPRPADALGIIKVNDEFRFLFNGEEVLRRSFPSLKSGTVMLWVARGSSAIFEDIKVSRLEKQARGRPRERGPTQRPEGPQTDGHTSDDRENWGL